MQQTYHVILVETLQPIRTPSSVSRDSVGWSLGYPGTVPQGGDSNTGLLLNRPQSHTVVSGMMS